MPEHRVIYVHSLPPGPPDYGFLKFAAVLFGVPTMLMLWWPPGSEVSSSVNVLVPFGIVMGLVVLFARSRRKGA